jgi:two-component system OmpR family response regulator/two-component system response regulator QseB
VRILLVEDDASLGSGIRAALMQAGYVVDWVRDGERAVIALTNPADIFNAVILDLGLPGCDGLSVLSSLRATGGKVPVLVLTARDTLNDKVAGLDAGADDYMLKPFDLAELRARLRALTRRSAGEATALLKHGEIALNQNARSVTKSGEVVNLTPREFALLELLLMRAGRVQTRADIESQLQGWHAEVDSNVVEVHISMLRKKLGDGIIRTIRGVGYMVEKQLV